MYRLSDFISPRLKPCDIILTKENTFKSKLIEYSTEGEYSHAMIYLGDGKIIDATGAGVKIKPIKNALDAVTGLDILQVNGLTAEQCQQAVQKIKHFVGREYAYIDAIGTLNKYRCKIKSDEGKFFCSELVVDIFKEAGITLTDRAATCITPDDLHKLPTVTPVTIIPNSEEPQANAFFEKRLNEFGKLINSAKLDNNSNFSELEKSILGAIAEDRAITKEQFAEFEHKCNDVLAYLQKEAQQQRELSQKIGRQEAQIAKVKQNVAIMQDMAAIGTFLLDKLFPDNPKVAKAFGTIAGAGIGIYAIVGMASFPPAAVVLGCIAAILPIFSLFGDDGEIAAERHQQIMEALQTISTQINDLHRDMHERMDGLHKHLGYVHESLSGQISDLSLQMNYRTFAISNQLGIVANNLQGLINDLSDHKQATTWRLDKVIEQLHHISEQVNLVPIQVTEIMSFFDAINGLDELNNNNIENTNKYFNQIFTHAKNSSLELYTSQQLSIEQYKWRFNTYKGRYLFTRLEVVERGYNNLTWQNADPRDINYNWSLSRVLGVDNCVDGLPNFIEMSKAIQLMVYYNFYYNIDLSAKFKELTTIAESHRQTLLKMAQPSFIKSIKENYQKAAEQLLLAIYGTLLDIEKRELSNSNGNQICALPTKYHLSYLNHHIPAVDLQVPNTQIDRANSLIAKIKQNQDLSTHEQQELIQLLQFFVENYDGNIEESYYWRDIKKAIANKKAEHIYTVKEGDTLTSIAKEKYGNGNKHTLISKSNSSIKNPDVIYPGQVLFIPPISHENNIVLSLTLDEQLNFYLKDDIRRIIGDNIKNNPEYIIPAVQSNQVFRETTRTQVNDKTYYYHRNSCFYYANSSHNIFNIAQNLGIFNVNLTGKETHSPALEDNGIVQTTADKGSMVINQGSFGGQNIEFLRSTEMYAFGEKETTNSNNIPVLKGFHYVMHLKNWQEQLGLTDKNYDLSDIKAIVEHIAKNDVTSAIRPINSVADLNLMAFLYNELHQSKYKPLKNGLAKKLENAVKSNEALKNAINNFEKYGLALLFYSTINRLVTSEDELTPVDYLINYAHEIYTFEDIVNFVDLYAQTNYMGDDISLSFWYSLSQDANPANGALKLNKDSLIDVIYYRLKTHIEETADETIARLAHPQADDRLPILRDIITLLKQQQH